MSPLAKVQAAWYDDKDDLWNEVQDLFDVESTAELSFTQFEGGITQLEPEGYDTSLTRSTDLKEYVLTVVNFALGFLGLLAVIIVIYGGVLYVTAGGEQEGTEKAKKAITYAAVGLLIVLGSFAFVNTVIKGASGEKTDIGEGIIGITTANGYNVSAEQIRMSALDIFNGFVVVADSAESFANIVTDANKPSLRPDEDLRRTDATNFLLGVKGELMIIKSQVDAFSAIAMKINDLIRQVELDLDTIKVVDDERFVEGWTAIYARYNKIEDSDSSPFGGIYRAIVANYVDKLRETLRLIIKIYGEVKVIESVGGDGTAANTAYVSMLNAYGIDEGGDKPQGDGVIQGLSAFNLTGGEEGIESLVGLGDVGDRLREALKYQSQLYQALKTLQFVEAHLTADVVEGNSPLTVTFDVLGTKDPAGGSIRDENIIWDIGGSQKLEDLQGAEVDNFQSSGYYGRIFQEDENVDCKKYETENNPEDISRTSIRCTFKRPGAYQAAVKIRSNDNKKFGPGISVLTINVKPPTTKIELKVGTSEVLTANEYVMHYDGDILKTDLRVITFTMEEAKSGITFDASETDAEKYKWTFGNGDSRDFSSSGKVESYKGYTKAGKYEVTLEVVSKLGVQDRKMFTIQIGDLAARFNVNPIDRVFVNSVVTFDASVSRSDIVPIKNYEWKITPVSQGAPQDASFENSGANLRVINHKFKYPLKYNISLTVTGDNGATSTFEVTNYIVESNPPVAVFDYEIPLKSKPGEVLLDASRSYDPDSEDTKQYLWTISPGQKGVDFEFLEAEDTVLSKVKFLRKGDFKITLRVSDSLNTEEFDEESKEIKIENILDIAFANSQEVTAVLNEEGKAPMDFKILSENAVAYEIDFGDGDISNGEISQEKTITHTYTTGGRYAVKVTVYDIEDNDNSIEKRIFIGSGNGKPVAKIDVFVNGAQVVDSTEPISVTKADIVTFDAGNSKNADGTSRKINYSWDLGDSTKSSGKTATHSYKELSPMDTGFFKVTLKVIDKDDASVFDEDEVSINVVNEPPKFSALQVLPISNEEKLITPVEVSAILHGAVDRDGDILQYKWWYYDLDDPEEPLGLQITTSPSTRMMIGTNGKEGKEITYAFGVELMDSDNAKVSSETFLAEEQIPKIKVYNGPNELPTASFSVSSTTVFSGDEVIFSSKSEDKDGSIVSYIWDFEGDGFFNNTPQEEGSITHTFTEKNLDGFSVRLKVVDDKGGEAISDPVKIYVDSLASKPVAAFKYEVVTGSAGKKIKFINNSSADQEAGATILQFKWDFDTDSNLESADSNGDGVKDNDKDSQSENPEHLYDKFGSYKVKLTVTDNQGNEGVVVNAIKIPLANPPVAAFTYEVLASKKIVFTNNSTADAAGEAEIAEYIWDFDLDVDSDGDGNPTNDKDSNSENPIFEFSTIGLYRVKLTVMDNQGNSDEVVNTIDVSRIVFTEGPIGGDTTMTPVLNISPAPGLDGIVYLTGEEGTVIFDFKNSTGPIADYVFDKNIYFDTDGNGIKNDDQDFKTSLPGTWTTNFAKSWGQIVVKFTVFDINKNEVSVTQEIAFK